MKRKILLVEDSKSIREAVKAILEEEDMQVVCADTTSLARKLFEEHRKKFDAVAVDGCVDTPRATDPDTLELIRWFRREGFSGPLIAYANLPHHRLQQCHAGCDLDVEKPRLIVALKGIFLLQTPTPPPPSPLADAVA